MKEIKLSQEGKNRGKYIALVDDEDYEYLNQFKWNANKIYDTHYVVRHIYYNNKRKTIYMHRVIMNTPDNMECDHVFHNTLDNRKFIEIDGVLKPNLRNCTHQQNTMNRKLHKDSKIKYIGVIYKADGKRIKRYYASIYVNKKKMSLGYYNTEVEAAKARDKASIENYGEFARLNFPINSGFSKKSNGIAIRGEVFEVITSIK